MASFPPDPESGSRAVPISPKGATARTVRKLARRAFRTESGRFVAEGWKAVEAAYDAGVLEQLIVTPAAAEQYSALLDRIDLPAHFADESTLNSLADAATPQGLLGIGRIVLGEVPGHARLVVVCADVRDPGNAGTVIRCADAVGADAVVLAGDSVDAFHPKTVRASVGSLFNLPVVVARDLPDALAELRKRGLRILAADGAGERDLFELDATLAAPTAWLFGNEAHGLSAEVAELADERVRIPIFGRAESLNLATAAAVCLYASAREQRWPHAAQDSGRLVNGHG